jgi:hypothetical protein
MTYTLTKLSAPGWEKTFNTWEEVEKEFAPHVCRECKEHYGADLYSMLASDCGCEYMLEDNILDKPITEEERIQDDYDKAS